jgi:hypothetical protein
MANVGLSFTLSANAAGMSQGINAGVVELEKLGLQAKKTSQDVAVLKGIEIGRVFISSVRAVASTFQRFTSGASRSIDQANKLSRALGITFGELRRLQLAADLSGASSEQLARAFTRAQVTITKAGQGAPQATAALQRLGLSVKDLAGLSTSDQFQRIAASIAGIQDPARRAAAAVEIFGRSGAQLLPVFQELAQNLKASTSFFDSFKSALTQEDADKVTAIKDAFTFVGAAVTETAGKILAQLAPALVTGARAVEQFLKNLDIAQVSRDVSRSLEQAANAASLLGRALGAGLQRPLVAIGATLAFINRQAIATSLAGMARAFAAAATAAFGYATGATTAAAATAALAASVRGLIVSTGVGALVVLLGVAGGAVAEWALSSRTASQEVDLALDGPLAKIKSLQDEFGAAARQGEQFGRELKAAFEIPVVSFEDLTKDAISQARSAFAGLAREVGGLSNVARPFNEQWGNIQLLVNRANNDMINSRVIQDQILAASDRLVESIKKVREQREADARAIQAQQDAAKAAQDRVSQLQRQGLSAAEQSRLKLTEDLLQVDLERRNAEAALIKARRDGDAAAILAARERLFLVQDAANAAREQDRQRQLQARGIDANLLRPAQTISDQLAEIRKAFQDRLIDPQQFRNALRNLVDEGVQIRRDLERELARPSQQALRVADVRSTEGIAAFFDLQREDPALRQREQQLQRLAEIRDAVRRNNLQVVDL